MSDEVVKPYLGIAAICEKVLQEEHNVLSAIRIVDRLFIDPATLEQVKKDTTPLVQVTLLLKFMSINYSGQHALSLKMLSPSGKERDLLTSVPLVFEAEGTGVQVKVAVNIAAKQSGRYWVVVYLDDEVFTRTPLEMLFQKEVS